VKIYVYPADTYGCGNYRMIWPAEAVATSYPEIDVKIVFPNEDTQIRGSIGPGNRIKDVSWPPDADVLVFQRPTHVFLAQAIPLMREAGVTVVVDMDDDLRTIHPSNPAFLQVHPKSNTAHNWQNAAIGCKHASLVTCSTPALVERYAPHGRGRWLPNKIPRRFLEVEHEDNVTIGWGGSMHSHPNDMAPVGAAVANLVGEGYDFKVVGQGAGVMKALSLRYPPIATGMIQFEDWPDVLTTIGVGIAPLADTAFNAAKSWLKPLEYAAVGVPWVASNRNEYRRLHTLGCGVVVDRPREWEAALRRILEDDAWRRELSNRGREVAATLTIEESAKDWCEAWTYAHQLQNNTEPAPA
jgi:glycosyltransferase involved in cell wall biosynthesis